MNKNGLIFGYLLDGSGGAMKIGWQEIDGWTGEEGILWLHFDYTALETSGWLTEKSQLDDLTAEALLAEETRPRSTVVGDGILMALRGANLNPGSDPEDMVSIRLWIDQQRVISTCKRPLLSVQDIVTALERGRGPGTPGEFIVELTERLMLRMGGTIEDMEERIGDVEEKIIVAESHALRSELATLRRVAISLRRYLAPQREAMIQLQNERVSWLSDTDKSGLHEVTNHLIRYIEDLDSIRSRAAVTQEELINRLSEQMNARMYLLSIVAAIFLPLGFLTGLLGINVGGIPGSENNSAFLIFIFVLAVVLIIQIFIFKRKKWL